jgi:hypothetical protein
MSSKLNLDTGPIAENIEILEWLNTVPYCRSFSLHSEPVVSAGLSLAMLLPETMA